MGFSSFQVHCYFKSSATKKKPTENSYKERECLPRRWNRRMGIWKDAPVLHKQDLGHIQNTLYIYNPFSICLEKEISLKCTLGNEPEPRQSPWVLHHSGCKYAHATRLDSGSSSCPPNPSDGMAWSLKVQAHPSFFCCNDLTWAEII